jgi:HTH-type transcriptional regulator, sugar sensing transcriptional regulator
MSLLYDKQLETLNELGLTLLQAKTYLNLAKVGEADIKTIAFTAKVARQDTYRILESLEKMGLAQKVLAKTTIYRATPIHEGLGLLLQRKKKQLSSIEKEVFREFQNFPQKKTAKLSLCKFTIISDFALLVNTHEKLLASSRRTIDTILPLKIGQPTFLSHFPSFQKALERGVKIRVITQKPKTVEENIDQSSGGLEIRHLPEKILFGMHIFDKKIVTIAVEEKKNLPCLWTNSPHVIEMSSTYFNQLWEKATN